MTKHEWNQRILDWMSRSEEAPALYDGAKLLHDGVTTHASGTTLPPKKPRGFAAISPERRSEIARRGGVAAHAGGTAHQFTKAEASAAGKKGGLAKHRARGRTPVVEE